MPTTDLNVPFRPEPGLFALRGPDGLAVLGRTLHDLRGIRFDEGEGGNAPAAGPAPTAPSAAPAPPNPVPAAPSSSSAPAATPPAATPPAKTYTAEETEAYIKRLRGEAQEHRQARTAAESQRDAVLTALGLTADGKPLPRTTEELSSALTAKEQAAAETARENLVLRVATAQGVDSVKIDSLLDSKSFSSKLSALEPTDRPGVEALIREAVQKDPSLAPAPAGASSSGGSTHSGAAPTTARKNMSDAVSARYQQ